MEVQERECTNARLLEGEVSYQLHALYMSLYCFLVIGRFTDPELFEQCKQEYLQEREEFRQTGIRKKMKRVSS